METLCFSWACAPSGRSSRGSGKRACARDTPAACIRSGTRPEQQTVVGTLADIAEDVTRAGFEPPAILVVGEVVKRRARLAWFERRPLAWPAHRRHARRGAGGEFVARLERLGAEAIAAPTIELEEVALTGRSDAALASLESFDWIVFTSAHGVAVFFARLYASGADVRRLGQARLAAIGSATANGTRGSRLARRSRAGNVSRRSARRSSGAARERPAGATSPRRRRSGGPCPTCWPAQERTWSTCRPIGPKPWRSLPGSVTALLAARRDRRDHVHEPEHGTGISRAPGGRGAAPPGSADRLHRSGDGRSRPCARLECRRGGARVYGRGADESLD